MSDIDDLTIEALRRMAKSELHSDERLSDISISFDGNKFKMHVVQKYSQVRGFHFLLADVEAVKTTIESERALWKMAQEFYLERLEIDRSQSIIIPPGSKLLRWSRLIFSKKFVDGEITNTIHDMQREYIESIAEDRKWHPKWVCVRGYMSYGVCVFCGLFGGVGKRIVDAWKGVNLS